MIELMNMTLSNRDLAIILTETGLKYPDVVKFDKRRLQQVLLNLLSNAVKFSKSGTILVTVNIKKQQNREALLEVQVKDEGVGIKQEE